MNLICNYFEDANIFIDNENKDLFRGEPFIFITMDCVQKEDYFLLNNMKWTYKSLDKDWAYEIEKWTEKHREEIIDIWNNENYHLIDERW